MSWKTIRLAILVILGLALAAVPGLVGCGGAETEKVNVVVGSLADFSGAASSAVVPTVDAYEEAIIYYQEKDPIKGVIFDFPHYDHQLNYAKTKDGYDFLKSQGMDFLYCMGGTERDILASFVAEDHMPTFGSYATDLTLALPFIYTQTPTQTWGSEAQMQWIAETWDYSGGPPKIGHQGWALSTSDEIQLGIQNALDDPDYAGKFNFVAFDKATMTNAAWTASYAKFKNCDYVFVSSVGNSLSTFVSQMRSLGYQGWFLSGCNQFPGYWTAVQATTPAASLYKCGYAWWGPILGSDNPADWYQDMLATIKVNHSDWAKRLTSTGPISGWHMGYITWDVIRRAVEKVGAENLDGDAINEAFLTYEKNFEGTGNVFKITANRHTGLWTHQMVVWNVDSSKWEVTADGKWYDPLVVPE